MPEQFENGRKLDGKDSLQGFDAKEVCLHPKNLSVSFQKRLKLFCFHHFQVFTRCSFPNVPIRVPFSKSTVFKICRQKMCRFRVNRRPIRRIFHRFQNVPASCERSLTQLINRYDKTLVHLYALLNRANVTEPFSTTCVVSHQATGNNVPRLCISRLS